MIPTISASIRVSGNEGITELCAQLEQSGLKPRFIKRDQRVIFPLNRLKRFPGNIPAFPVPPQVEEATLLLNAREQGGLGENGGTGSIISDLEGRPLRPYAVTTNKEMPNGIHAHFAVKDSLIIIDASNAKATISINQFSIDHEFPVAWVYSFCMLPEWNLVKEWKCEACKKNISHEMRRRRNGFRCPKCRGALLPLDIILPRSLQKFGEACLAAMQKAGCKNCRHVHFAELTKGA